MVSALLLCIAILFAWLATIGSWEIDEYQAFDYVLWQVAWKKYNKAFGENYCFFPSASFVVRPHLNLR